MITTRPIFLLPVVGSILVSLPLSAGSVEESKLEKTFSGRVRPFLENHCLSCHGANKPKADFDLSPYSHLDLVVRDHLHWEMVLEKLKLEEMPPAKATNQPSALDRKEIIEWIESLRRHEAKKNAGDPGPVLARRLSNAEFDYTIHDLTGVNIRPTREFPVDPANPAGFDNSGESLAMSPALFKKYLQAARLVSDHLVLKPDGIDFAPHPVLADTDRDKYSVLRIVRFYQRQPTDYADYFQAAWRFKHRRLLGKPKMTLAEAAGQSGVSAKYLSKIWEALHDPREKAGPIFKLQGLWGKLARPSSSGQSGVRAGCEEMRNFVVSLREKLVPEVKNLSAPGIQNGSQTLVMWKNRQMAANRRRFDPGAFQVEGVMAAPEMAEVSTKGTNRSGTNSVTKTNAPPSTAEIIQKGGTFLPPTLITTAGSATSKMAASRRRGADPDLVVPADPIQRATYEAAFDRFADLFPDAFFITERARVYMDAQKEQQNSGRLLSAGLHSMTGYFRDDGPLYDLILDERGRRELDALWKEFDFVAAVPERMHTSFVWFERTDSSYMRDPEFDPYRPEDKSIHSPEKIKSLAEIYLAKAQRNNAGEKAQEAIRQHFAQVAENIARVEKMRRDAEPVHLQGLQTFAERAFRRPLTSQERQAIDAFYLESRQSNHLEHEEAMRDSIAGILMSPHFSYRIDLGNDSQDSRPVSRRATGNFRMEPLSDHALASRLSYFLWSSLPDRQLLQKAAAGELRRPGVLAAEARRMLKDGKVGRLATEFGGHWLDFRRFQEHNSVDRERFPSFDSDLRQAMFEEPIRFFVHLIQKDRPVLDFLHGDYTFVNGPLSRHYGMPVVAAGTNDWVRVDGASQYGRGGLLPMSVFLTANSPGLRTSPVKRGYWVVRRILGERIPPPPAVVPDLPNDEKHLGDLTLRQALSRHREDPACAGCHARFDSFGLVFENYGPVGEQRLRDFGGRPIDVRAEFPGGREESGVEGLRHYLKQNREGDFMDNLCRKLLAYALGRSLILSDEATVAGMRSKIAANGYRFESLVEYIVTSPQFMNKRLQSELAKN